MHLHLIPFIINRLILLGQKYSQHNTIKTLDMFYGEDATVQENILAEESLNNSKII